MRRPVCVDISYALGPPCHFLGVCFVSGFGCWLEEPNAELHCEHAMDVEPQHSDYHRLARKGLCPDAALNQQDPQTDIARKAGDLLLLRSIL